MLKLVIANRRYSSWSLRAWLAARHSGLPFEEVMVDLYADDWQQRRARPDIAVSGGTVPVLWDGDTPIWNTMAIIGWLDHLSGGTRFWPTDKAARAFTLSAAMEMQAGFVPLRKCCPMNVMRNYTGHVLTVEATADVARISHLWETALNRFGGPWLGGAGSAGQGVDGAGSAGQGVDGAGSAGQGVDGAGSAGQGIDAAGFGAADMMYAPIASRLTTYDVQLSSAADGYRRRLMAHPLVAEWVAEAAHETRLSADYEY